MKTKIVRDRAPDYFFKNSRPCLVKFLEDCDPADQRKFLAAKIREEADELAVEIEFGRWYEMIEELGDISDVLDFVKHFYEIPAHNLENVRRNKAEKRGGFVRGTVVTYE